MGPESDHAAVVDQFGRVFGVEGVRVADTSIMGGLLDVPPGSRGAGRFQGLADTGAENGASGIFPALVLHLGRPRRSGHQTGDQYFGDDNVVVATDYGHPEGRHYSRAVEEVLSLPGVSKTTNHKIMWTTRLSFAQYARTDSDSLELRVLH
jgi:hypothetical protein